MSVPATLRWRAVAMLLVAALVLVEGVAGCSRHSSAFPCLSNTSCVFCTSTGRCIEAVEAASSCPGYHDACSSFNANPWSCRTAFYTVLSGTALQWATTCATDPSNASRYACAGCRYCAQRSQCLTAASHTAVCPTAWGGYCSFSDAMVGDTTACNLLQPVPLGSPTCPDTLYPTGCGPCAYCVSSRQCLAEAALSNATCCGYRGSCSVWVTEQDTYYCSNYERANVSEPWTYCGGEDGGEDDCTCYLNTTDQQCMAYGTDNCPRYTEHGVRACLQDGECVRGVTNRTCGCAFCPSSQMCVSGANALTTCTGWRHLCNSMTNISDYVCMQLPLPRGASPRQFTCVWCPRGEEGVGDCEPRSVLRDAGSLCRPNCTSYRWYMPLCLLSGCNYCHTTGDCVSAAGSNTSCHVARCSQLDNEEGPCSLNASCAYCPPSGRCLDHGADCNPCLVYRYSQNACNTYVYDGIASQFTSNCTSTSCTACAYCTRSGDCLRATNVSLATCPSHTAPCSIWDGIFFSCNTSALRCTFCPRLNRCMPKGSPGSDAAACNICSQYAGSAISCNMLFSTPQGARTGSCTPSGSFTCDRCVYCNATRTCMPSSLAWQGVGAGGCPGLTSNCSVWNSSPSYCEVYNLPLATQGWVFNSGGYVGRQCRFCPRTQLCMPNTTDFDAACPGVGNCSLGTPSETSCRDIHKSNTSDVWFQRPGLCVGACFAPCYFCRSSGCLLTDAVTVAVCPALSSCNVYDSNIYSCNNGLAGNAHCGYCTAFQACLVRTDAVALCPGWTSNCSLWGSDTWNCNQNAYLVPGQCGYCWNTRQCVARASALALCPGWTSNCSMWDNDLDRCNGNSYVDTGLCGYCWNTSQCVARASAPALCPGWTSNCSLWGSDNWNCNQNTYLVPGQCGYCWNTSQCVARASAPALCPGWTSNCSLWGSDNGNCNQNTYLVPGQCGYCWNTSQCVARASAPALCPGWTSNCSMWGTDVYSCNAHTATALQCAFCHRTNQCLPRPDFFTLCADAGSLCNSWVTPSDCVRNSPLAFQSLGCFWCASLWQCMPNTTAALVCRPRCIDQDTTTPCQRLGCHWCTRDSSCAETAALCDPCTSLARNTDMLTCNQMAQINTTSPYMTSVGVYNLCSGHVNCVPCMFCNVSVACLALPAAIARCPGWGGNCSRWSGRSIGYCATGVSPPSFPQGCAYCAASTQCLARTAVTAATCCSAYDSDSTNCRSLGCVFCPPAGTLSSRCLHPTNQSQCNPCATLNSNWYSCNRVFYSWTSSTTVSSCATGHSCVKCAFCPSTRLCLTNTTIATPTACPGWTDPCSVWSNYSSSASQCIAQNFLPGGTPLCSFCPADMRCRQFPAVNNATATCASACSQYYDTMACARSRECFFCAVDGRCLPTGSPCQPCLQWSGANPANCVQSAWYNSTNRTHVACGYCPTSQQCGPVQPSGASLLLDVPCPAWRGLCSSNDGQPTLCNMFQVPSFMCPSRLCPGCGYCHASGRCLNASTLTAATCSSHRDVCSVWGADGTSCSTLAFSNAAQLWQAPPCVAQVCDYCGMCIATGQCMAVASLPAACGVAWSGPCGNRSLAACRTSPAPFFFDAPSWVVDSFCRSGCCNAECKPCAATGLCNTVRPGDAACSAAALANAAPFARGPPGKSGSTSGSASFSATAQVSADVSLSASGLSPSLSASASDTDSASLSASFSVTPGLSPSQAVTAGTATATATASVTRCPGQGALLLWAILYHAALATPTALVNNSVAGETATLTQGDFLTPGPVNLTFIFDFPLTLSATTWTPNRVEGVTVTNVTFAPAGTGASTGFAWRKTSQAVTVEVLLGNETALYVDQLLRAGGGVVNWTITTSIMMDAPCFDSPLEVTFRAQLAVVVPLVPVVSAAVQSTATSAIAASVATSAVAGPGGASDIQAVILIMLAKCSPTTSLAEARRASPTEASGGYMLVTSFALADSALGALGGNLAVFTLVLVVQLVLVAVARFAMKRTVRGSCATMRFPGLLLLGATTMHQSTLFCALRLLTGNSQSSSGGGGHVFLGVVALLACLAVPVLAVLAVVKVPRRYTLYQYTPATQPAKAGGAADDDADHPFGMGLKSPAAAAPTSLGPGHAIPSDSSALAQCAEPLLVHPEDHPADAMRVPNAQQPAVPSATPNLSSPPQQTTCNPPATPPSQHKGQPNEPSADPTDSPPPGPSRFRHPAWRYFVPEGIMLPVATRQMLSSLIAGYRLPALLCGVLPYISSFVSNLPAALPASSPPWLCASSMFLSVVVHVALASWILFAQVYRAPLSNVFGALGLYLTAAFHAQVAVGFDGGVGATVALQAGLCLCRSVAAVGMMLLERQVQCELRDGVVTLSDPCVWLVGDGGHDEVPPAAEDGSQQEMTAHPVGMGLDVAMAILLGDAPAPAPAPAPAAPQPPVREAVSPVGSSSSSSSSSESSLAALERILARDEATTQPQQQPSDEPEKEKANSDFGSDFDDLFDADGSMVEAAPAAPAEVAADPLLQLLLSRSIGHELVIDEHTQAPSNPFRALGEPSARSQLQPVAAVCTTKAVADFVAPAEKVVAEERSTAGEVTADKLAPAERSTAVDVTEASEGDSRSAASPAPAETGDDVEL